jgi:hypothetical protein
MREIVHAARWTSWKVPADTRPKNRNGAVSKGKVPCKDPVICQVLCLTKGVMSLYLIQHENETRLSLIVLVVEAASQHVPELRERMFGSGCAHGMVIDEQEVIVLRDMFVNMEKDSIKVDFKLKTDGLLGSEGDLDERVRRWLKRMSTNWRATLDDADSNREQLLSDIVPALSGAVIDHRDSDVA